MKPKWLDRSLVEAPFFYTLATSESAFRKALDHLGVPADQRPAITVNQWSDAAVHWFAKDQKLTAVVSIRLRKGLSRPQLYGLLAHEATHLWQEARLRLGEKLPSIEFEAYAIQALAQRLFEEYERQTKEKS